MSTRITTVADATIKEEVVSPGFIVSYDAQTQEGIISFALAVEKSINDVYVRTDPLQDRVAMSIDEMLEYVFEVPLPDGTTMHMPGALFFLGAKAVFDKIYEVRFGPTPPPEE